MAHIRSVMPKLTEWDLRSVHWVIPYKTSGHILNILHKQSQWRDSFHSRSLGEFCLSHGSAFKEAGVLAGGRQSATAGYISQVHQNWSYFFATKSMVCQEFAGLFVLSSHLIIWYFGEPLESRLLAAAWTKTAAGLGFTKEEGRGVFGPACCLVVLTSRELHRHVGFKKLQLQIEAATVFGQYIPREF